MPSKIDMFLNHMRSNPEKAMTVYEIMHRFDVTNVTAYSWANHKYVKEERVGAKPKRVIFNAAKWDADHNGATQHRSVDKAFTKAADSLSGELRAAHTNCIRKANLTNEQCADILQKLIDGAVPVDLNYAVRIIMDKKRKSAISSVRNTVVQTLSVLDYMESILPDD